MNTLELKPLFDFLSCETPRAWIDAALPNQATLLIDHAHCEKKAASTGMSIIFRYPDQAPELLQQMSRLAREELRHFEQVLRLMNRRGISFNHLSPSRYAGGLRAHARNHEPAKLIDTLIIGAFIEARSCERFHALIPHLDPELAKFYGGLLASEARHFEVYLALAERIANESLEKRIAEFAAIEADLIISSDPEFRFHGGVPETAKVVD